MADTPDTHHERAPDGERIAKRLARAGLCSRRDAEVLIREGRVKVNGKVLETPAYVVGPNDQILVDDQPLPEAEATRLWRYHKPAGLVTTARDEKGRSTVFDRLPEDMPRVVSIGRLDLTTEGLLLLTNDGALARHLELPATGWTRRYRVRVHGRVDPAKLSSLAQGITLDGVKYGPIEATLDREQGANAWLTVGLKEGKNREIRKVMEHLGLQVTRLIRVAYGPFQLGKLPRGAVEEVPRRVLKDQIPAFFDTPGQAGGGRPAPGAKAEAKAGAKAGAASRSPSAPPSRPKRPARAEAPPPAPERTGRMQGRPTEDRKPARPGRSGPSRGTTGRSRDADRRR